MRVFWGLWIVIVLIFSGQSCHRRSDPTVPVGGTVVIALPADADALNPLLWRSSSTGAVLQFLFPDLLEMDFDTARGLVTFKPALAKSWEWNADGTALTYHLRTDAFWEDSMPVTAHDIKYSYILYAHPQIPSVRKNYLQYFFKNAKGEADPERSIEVPNDSTLTFRFIKAYEKNQQLAHTQLNFIPRHIAEKIPPSEWATSSFNERPVSGKHYRLLHWKRKQEIVLTKNERWRIPHAAYPDRIVFRIIPDMNTRVIELKTGGVDIVEGLSPEDARRLTAEGVAIRIEKQSYRRFDYVGWNHLDPAVFSASKAKTILPHPLFGDARVRRALTMAIDRQTLIDGWLGEYGQLCNGPVSPAFKWAFHDSLNPLPYDPQAALALLKEAGWEDHNGDGWLDRNGKKFEFTLVSNTGNPRREFALQRIQNDLKQIGIVCNLQLYESNVFSAGLKNRQYDAFIGGVSTSLTLDLAAQFGSNLQTSAFNYYAYQNPVVDSLIQVINSYTDITQATPVIRRVQEIIHEDQPVTFLYWFDNLVGIRQHIRGTRVDMLSPYHRYYEWYVESATR